MVCTVLHGYSIVDHKSLKIIYQLRNERGFALSLYTVPKRLSFNCLITHTAILYSCNF